MFRIIVLLGVYNYTTGIAYEQTVKCKFNNYSRAHNEKNGSKLLITMYTGKKKKKKMGDVVMSPAVGTVVFVVARLVQRPLMMMVMVAAAERRELVVVPVAGRE